MFSRFKPFGKVPPTVLAPGLPEHAQKAELYESAAIAMRAHHSRNVLRRRVLSDDPQMAAVPIGCREGVLVSPVGRVRVTDRGVRGLFKLTAVPIAR